MNILTEAKVASAIRQCQPTKIAVAFLGANWREFITDVTNLQYVIVSPELGTNPSAVRALAEEIGWERVHLFDRLHAKVYLGEQGAVVGSANLSKNGLSGDGLIELCISLSSGAKMLELEGILDGWRAVSQGQYPTERAKLSKLVEMDAEWAKAIVHGLAPKPNQVPSILDFSLSQDDDFYVCWYQDSEEPTYSSELRQQSKTFNDDMHFAKGDVVSPYKWVLAWKATNALRPHLGKAPYWLFIHQVFKNGIVDKGYEYPQCGIQRNDLQVPPVPFELTKDVVAAFRQAMQMPDFRKYFVQEGGIFRLSKSQKGLPALVEYLREAVGK